MKRLLYLLIAALCLSACSQKQFGFRQKVNAGKDLAAKQPHKKHESIKPAEAEEPVSPYAAVENPAESPISDSLIEQEASSTKRKMLLSASVLKEIIPFSTEHLSPGEPETHALQPRQNHEMEGGVFGYISLILGLLSIFALLSLVFVTSNTLGVLLLFSAPVLGAVALIFGIMSVSDNNGRGMGWAGIVMGSFILLVTLVMVLVAYLFIQSSIN